jgi:hypothetical protein
MLSSDRNCDAASPKHTNVRPAHLSESSSLFLSQMRATECFTRD